ncbi:MAG TPA: hypothetical protein ENN29_10770 [Candidatus Hydrogenedentes bacterium]|nr:hypothetical protein [Candidatus Hydrogenedentota bacterium]
MKIDSKYVGAVCKPLELEVTTRQCMNYAASIGDDNPWHLDDTREAGIIAPPMLAIALTWRISEHFNEFWEDADFPYEALARQVHFSEHLRWERPIRPGDRLRIEGKVAAILPHRAGTHLIIAYKALDAKENVVFTEHIGGLLRGVLCADAGRGVDVTASAKNKDTDNVLWSRKIHLSKFAPYLYDGCADVHFPIHISPAFANYVGLPGIIYQGTGTLAMAVSQITATEAGNDPRRIRAVQCRFTGMVRPDTDIVIRLSEREQTDEICRHYFVVLNDKGKAALSDGCVEIGPA